MPLYEDAIEKIRYNLKKLEKDERVGVLEVGEFTAAQFTEINALRTEHGLFLLEENTILFMGRHLYKSRSQDGYTVDDMVDQIMSAMGVSSVVLLNKNQSSLINQQARADKYGNQVRDKVVFEMYKNRPKAELFSAMPKGDSIKPK